MELKDKILTNLQRAIEEINYNVSNPEGARVCIKVALNQINTLIKNESGKEKNKETRTS